MRKITTYDRCPEEWRKLYNGTYDIIYYERLNKFIIENWDVIKRHMKMFKLVYNYNF